MRRTSRIRDHISPAEILGPIAEGASRAEPGATNKAEERGLAEKEAYRLLKSGGLAFR